LVIAKEFTGISKILKILKITANNRIKGTARTWRFFQALSYALSLSVFQGNCHALLPPLMRTVSRKNNIEEP